MGREFSGGDLDTVLHFLSGRVSESPPQAYWHPGDFVWTLFQNSVFDATKNVRLWEDDGEIAGFALLEEPDCVVMQVRRDLPEEREIRREMLLWATGNLKGGATGEIGARHTELLGEDEDSASAFFEDIGMFRDGDHYLNMHRPLDDGFVSRIVPHGWEVRPVGSEEEWSKRIELHQEVWNSRKVTLEAYRRLRNAPGYDPVLDLIAVNEAGEFGAYCICWYDPASRVGLFEPVGTHENFRRTGLGRAVMYEGLTRLSNLGAKSAFVTSAGNNDAARLLYESVGFVTVGFEYTFGGKMKDILPNL